MKSKLACILFGHKWGDEVPIGCSPMDPNLCYHRNTVFVHTCRRCGKTKVYIK